MQSLEEKISDFRRKDRVLLKDVTTECNTAKNQMVIKHDF